MDGLYKCFSKDFWDRKEPLARRPQSDAIRRERMVERLIPTFSNPHCHWMITKYLPTGDIISSACWVAPGSPVHNFFRKSAVDYYGWRDQFKCSDDEFEELWSHVDDEQWNGHFASSDAVRTEILGDEPHWYLATLFTWPEWQGRGVGKLLLDWAIKQADANHPPTPMYLESSLMARAVYMHCGFVPQGEDNFVRRGPVVVNSPKPEKDKDHTEAGQANTDDFVMGEVAIS